MRFPIKNKIDAKVFSVRLKGFRLISVVVFLINIQRFYRGGYNHLKFLVICYENLSNDYFNVTGYSKNFYT